MKNNQEQLRAMLVEIYNCASAWDNDDGKMAEANEKTPEDILVRYLEDAKKEGIKGEIEKYPHICGACERGISNLSHTLVCDFRKKLLKILST